MLRATAHVCEVAINFIQFFALPIKLLKGVRRQRPRLIGCLHTAQKVELRCMHCRGQQETKPTVTQPWPALSLDIASGLTSIRQGLDTRWERLTL